MLFSITIVTIPCLTGQIIQRDLQSSSKLKVELLVSMQHVAWHFLLSALHSHRVALNWQTFLSNLTSENPPLKRVADGERFNRSDPGRQWDYPKAIKLGGLVLRSLHPTPSPFILTFPSPSRHPIVVWLTPKHQRGESTFPLPRSVAGTKHPLITKHNYSRGTQVVAGSTVWVMCRQFLYRAFFLLLKLHSTLHKKVFK